jgi:DNA repair exonuclease SbcCD nuclease subunit
MKKIPIAVACSDLHFLETPPLARAEEKDWMKKQEEALCFVRAQAVERKVPLLIAGDIFHKPKVTPLVEIMVMRVLAGTHYYSIPGQHDLPNHLVDNINHSSYGVLMEHKKHTGINLKYYDGEKFEDIVHLFPFGSKVTDGPGDLSIALVHQMVWKGKPPYPGAPESGNVTEFAKNLQGYTFVVCGDNHKGFSCQIGKTTVVNCGSLMRRTADQEDYRPRCYVLYSDGTVEPIYLPIEDDVFTREHRNEAATKNARVEAFVSRLTDIELDLSFETNLSRFCEKNEVKKEVVDILMESLNG